MAHDIFEASVRPIATHSRIRKAIGLFALFPIVALFACQSKPFAVSPAPSTGPKAPPIAVSPTPSSRVTALPFPLDQLQKDWGFVTTFDECEKLTAKGQQCLYYSSAIPLQRPVWRDLFPPANFWLIKLMQYSPSYGLVPDGGGMRAGPRIVAEQNGQLYMVSTFDQLLQSNGILAADDQRGRIAEAFALMTLPYYIENEIVFSDSAGGNFQIPGRPYRFDYRLVAFTRLNGLRVEYYFAFDSKGLALVEFYTQPSDNRGLAYTPVPFPLSNTLPWMPADQVLDFRK